MIMRWLHGLHRNLDRRLLWPTLVQHAPDLDVAKAAFAFHAFHDPAWIALGEAEILRQIDELTP